MCEKGGFAPLPTLFRHLQAVVVKNPALFGQNQALFGQNLGLAGSGEKPAARKQDKNIWLAESLAETPAGRKQDKIRWAPQIRAVAAWADSI